MQCTLALFNHILHAILKLRKSEEKYIDEFVHTHISHIQLLDLRSSASSAASALNNTLRSEQRLLFFNRVPKAGTTSLAMWMGVLAARNGYQHFAYRITDNVDSEITVMDKQLSCPRPRFSCSTC